MYEGNNNPLAKMIHVMKIFAIIGGVVVIAACFTLIGWVISWFF